MTKTGRPKGTTNQPGHDAGRPTIYDDAMERHTVTLPGYMWRMIEEAGGGNRSAGLRRIMQAEGREVATS